MWVALSVVTTAIATWALVLLSIEPSGSFARRLNSAFNLLPVAFGGFAVALILAALLFGLWLKRFVLGALGTTAEVIDEVEAASNAAFELKREAATKHAAGALKAAIAWYGDRTSQRFTVQTILALLVTFGGLVGTGLLLRQTLLLGEQNLKLQEQTALLRDQNTKLDLQTVTAEAQRRAGLVAELFSILQAVSGEAGKRGKEALRLSPELVSRIVAFSRAATRYWIAEVPDRAKGDDKVPVPRFADQPRSPERGQLLEGLVAAGVDITALAKAGVTFADADLRGAVLRGANLQDANLQSADLRDAILRGAVLQGTNLQYADLLRAVLQGAYLQGAVLRSAYLQGAKLQGADLQHAVLQGTGLHDADLQGADLRHADLQGAYLQGAKLQGADLQGAIVGSSSDLTLGQLPKGFPEGWSAAPAGWELFAEGDIFRLRRVSAPTAAPTSPPQ